LIKVTVTRAFRNFSLIIHFGAQTHGLKYVLSLFRFRGEIRVLVLFSAGQHENSNISASHLIIRSDPNAITTTLFENKQTKTFLCQVQISKRPCMTRCFVQAFASAAAEDRTGTGQQHSQHSDSRQPKIFKCHTHRPGNSSRNPESRHFFLDDKELTSHFLMLMNTFS